MIWLLDGQRKVLADDLAGDTPEFIASAQNDADRTIVGQIPRVKSQIGGLPCSGVDFACGGRGEIRVEIVLNIALQPTPCIDR